MLQGSLVGRKVRRGKDLGGILTTNGIAVSDKCALRLLQWVVVLLSG